MTTDDLTLTVTGMAHGGDAVARHEGKAVFIPGAMSWETVRVTLVDERERFSRARLLEVLAPSQERVAPRCPHFGTCGGCQWQYMGYPAQLREKREIVRSLLERTGGQTEPDVREVVGMAEPWGYRNHVQLRRDDQGRIGYYAAKSHDVVPVDHCPLVHPLLDEMWGALDIDLPELQQIVLRAGLASGEQMLILQGRDEPPELSLELPISCLWQGQEGQVSVLAGDDCIHERLGSLQFRVSGPSFFQVNSEQAEVLIDVARRALALKPGERLLDAYCGVGAFMLSLGQEASQVIGIESSPWALDDAAVNAQAVDWRGDVALYEGDVAEVLSEQPMPCDAIVVDPPRSGLSREALESLVACGASRWVYVACDPASLARDVKRLAQAGYRLAHVQPVDLFPQTYHIESVALLVR